MTQNLFSTDRQPVPVDEIRVEGIGLNPLDKRRVDIAVDLTPCQVPVTVEMVIVGPEDDELCSILLVQNREWMLDKVMHLRRDAQPGTYTFHVGIFDGDDLVARDGRRFQFPPAALSPRP